MPRLNLSIPPQMDAALRELQKLTGVSMASVALQALADALPGWKRTIRDHASGAVVLGKLFEAVSPAPASRLPGEGRAEYRARMRAVGKAPLSKKHKGKTALHRGNVA